MITTPIKEKPLTKTEIKVLEKMCDGDGMGYGQVLMGTREFPYSRVIRGLIQKKLARRDPNCRSYQPSYALITDAGRKALGDGS